MKVSRSLRTLVVLTAGLLFLGGCGGESADSGDTTGGGGDPTHSNPSDPLIKTEDETITLPTTTATLHATVSDSLASSGIWTFENGPTKPQLDHAKGFDADVTGLDKPGAYTFTLLVREPKTNAGHRGTEIITVLAHGHGGPDHRPVVSAGDDVTIQFPTNEVDLHGKASDPDGDKLTLHWSQTDGAAASIAGGSSLSPKAGGLNEGSYTFELAADDGRGGKATSDVHITVQKAPTGPGVTTLRPLGSTPAPFGFVEYLPAGYAPGGNWPLMIFLHGAGEVGNGTTDLGKVRVNGPNHQIDANGMEIPMVILSPQTDQGAWEEDVGNVTRIDQLITYALQTYGVDAKRVYLTGLSLGGGGTWAYAAVHADRLAAIIPVCGFSGLYDPASAKEMILAGIGVWAAHALDDTTVSPKNTTDWLATFAQNYDINTVSDPTSLPGAPPVWTGITDTTTFYIDAQGHSWKQIDGQVDKDGNGHLFDPKVFGTFYPTGGHAIWERMYGDPNIYTWLLTQSRP